MPASSCVFAQIMSALHPQEFTRCVERFPPPRRPRGLSAYDHFLAMCFAQLTGREGLRDLVVCLNARPARTYQAGFRTRLTRTNLAYANAQRDWRVLAAVAQVLMRRATRLYTTHPIDPHPPPLGFLVDSSLFFFSFAGFFWCQWNLTPAAGKFYP